LAGLYVLPSGWFFTGIYRRAMKNGLIARYSPESVT